MPSCRHAVTHITPWRRSTLGLMTHYPSVFRVVKGIPKLDVHFLLGTAKPDTLCKHRSSASYVQQAKQHAIWLTTST